jgi:hypothetical protein
MSNVFFNYDTKEDLEVLDRLRSVLPADYFKAKKTLSYMERVLDLEQQNLPDPVRIDVTVGTYVRAIKFLDTSTLQLVFNEGTRKDVSQNDGSYAIGEDVYYLLGSVRGTCLFNVYHHNLATNYLAKFIDRPYEISNKKWMTMLYDWFPSARKDKDDALYNYYDTNGYCSRIEHFRSYLTSGVALMLSKLPDDRRILVCGLLLSKESHYLLSDMLRNLNSKRFYNFVFVSSDDVLDTNDYVVYVENLWVNPSSFDHHITTNSNSDRNLDFLFERALGDREKFLSSNSILVTGSYTPVLDVFYADGAYYSASLDAYSYSQLAYVPHKPWTLLAIGSTMGSFLPVVQDSSVVDMVVRHRYRTMKFLRMSYINLRRNVSVSKSKFLQEMTHTKLLKDKLLSIAGSPDKWFLTRIMRRDVSLKAKRLAYDFVDPVKATDLTVKVAGMKENTYYSQNQLTGMKWSMDTISRALSLGLITVWKDGTMLKYKKFDRNESMFRNVFQNPGNSSYRQASVINSDGSISMVVDSVSDSMVYVAPTISVVSNSGKEFNQENVEVEFPSSASSRSRFKFKGSMEMHGLVGPEENLFDRQNDIVLLNPGNYRGGRGKKKKKKKKKNLGERRKAENEEESAEKSVEDRLGISSEQVQQMAQYAKVREVRSAYYRACLDEISIGDASSIGLIESSGVDRDNPDEV